MPERPRNVFVVGLDGFHRDLLATMRGADEIAFHALFDADEIANWTGGPMAGLLDRAHDVLDRFDEPVDGIIGHWDFPTSTILPILRDHCDLPGPSLEAVLKCEHKYWSRLEQARVVPEHVPDFTVFDPFDHDARDQVDLDYPFWVKPIKSHSSYLGFHVADDRDFADAVERLRDGIHEVARPFDVVLEHADLPAEVADVGGHHCLAEAVISAPRQCTLEGYRWRGTTTIYGTIDTGRAGAHGSSLVEYGYPSALDEATTRRMHAIADRTMAALGYDRAPFNIEFFHDPDTDALHVLEVNPRISKSHSPLFLLVDGASHHQVAVRLALGQDPDFPSGEGEFPFASKFMLRHHGGDARVVHSPTPDELSRVQEQFPELRLHVHVEPGMALSDLPMQDSYSYRMADLFLGGDDPEQVRERFERCREQVPIELAPISHES
ncbi:ATP-grasp domain-containing protein [Salsipaludibacter albus]|uniref:ATP-grasp domain-containing protein n=1 Tax=Salsipaludibacter albus TaxID=2849650 RepID=UPI001EE4848B|nr:D-alanine--D-alanine ligase [Salsipaludibacter albus]